MKCIECKNKAKQGGNLCGVHINKLWNKINKERLKEWDKQYVRI